MLREDTQDRLIGWCRQALRFVLPVECIACGRSLSADPVPFFCTACWHTIRPLQHPVCARCDQPFVSPAATTYTPNHQCQHCQERPPDFQRAWTLFPYLPPLREAICSFKYRGKHTLARPLARLMISALPSGIDVDVIIPVPLHPTRLRTREFNQSLLLANQLSRHLARQVSPTNLVRVMGRYFIFPRKSWSRCARRRLTPSAPTPRHKPAHYRDFLFRHSHGGTGCGSGHAMLKNKWVAVTDFRYDACRNVPSNPSEEEGT